MSETQRPPVDISSLPRVTPHENLLELRKRIHENKKAMPPEDRHFLSRLYSSGYMRLYAKSLRGKQQMDMQTQTMAAVNGLSKEQAAVLANKYTFLEWVREQTDIPVSAPLQLLHSPSSGEDTFPTQLTETFGNTAMQIRCKPLEGTRGRGQRVFATPEEAMNFLATSHEPYVVQENMQDIRYSRYVAYVDEQDTLWRFAEVQKPDTKRKFPNPPADEKILARLDTAMLPLMGRIRESFGDNVKLFCFDLAIPREEDKHIAVIEYQIPYVALGYPLTTPKGIQSYGAFHRLIAQEQGNQFVDRFEAMKTTP